MTSAPIDSTDDPPVHRVVVVACSAALLTLLPVSAHQLGYLHHLPDPPGKAFASDRITGSEAAHPFGLPDGLLGLASYSVTLALALNASRSLQLRRALALKLVLDSSLAGFNMVRQVISFPAALLMVYGNRALYSGDADLRARNHSTADLDSAG